jgi:hypothetical protein
VTSRLTKEWIHEAVQAAADGQLVLDGAQAVPGAVERLDALLRGWAIGFHARRPDVRSPTLHHGRRGLHPDECAAFLRGLDLRLLHVDSAGYVVPLCADPKPNQSPYALCCKDGDGVGVNLEYVIQLGVLCELSSVYGWPRHQLRMELGEFDAAALHLDGSPTILMEAKARVTGGDDTLERLALKWLGFAEDPAPTHRENAANKYVELLAVATKIGPVGVLLAAAGARWWLTAEVAEPGKLAFAIGSPSSPRE